MRLQKASQCFFVSHTTGTISQGIDMQLLEVNSGFSCISATSAIQTCTFSLLNWKVCQSRSAANWISSTSTHPTGLPSNSTPNWWNWRARPLRISNLPTKQSMCGSLPLRPFISKHRTSIKSLKRQSREVTAVQEGSYRSWERRETTPVGWANLLCFQDVDSGSVQICPQKCTSLCLQHRNHHREIACKFVFVQTVVCWSKKYYGKPANFNVSSNLFEATKGHTFACLIDNEAVHYQFFIQEIFGSPWRLPNRSFWHTPCCYSGEWVPEVWHTNASLPHFALVLS